jgi:hypothetical protein
VGVQEVRWDRRGTEPAGECTFFYGKGNENLELDTGFLFCYLGYWWAARSKDTTRETQA